MSHLICNDCLNVIKTLDSDLVDLIVIDPPYEINYNNEHWDKKVLDWNILFSEFSRLLKPTGNLIMFQGWSNVCETISIAKQHFQLKNWIIYMIGLKVEVRKLI